ncbi:MAG: glycosyltransferase family 39 protein [Vicinamibacterales bacterium]
MARSPNVDLKRLALALACLTALLGLRFGTFAASGSDSYGYVSQADLWLQRTLIIDEPLADEAPWRNANWTLTPFGYRPGDRRGTMVPTYSPGLPIVMAMFKAVGGSDAVFYVVPLLGALTVWLTYLLGARLSGPLTGLLAAAALMVSPPFLFQLMWPMSDVPATAWWLLSIVLATRGTAPALVAAGVAAALALLTRPNLVLLVVPMLAFVMMRPTPEVGCVGDDEALWRSGRHGSPDRARRLRESASSRSWRAAAARVLAARSGHRPASAKASAARHSFSEGGNRDSSSPTQPSCGIRRLAEPETAPNDMLGGLRRSLASLRRSRYVDGALFSLAMLPGPMAVAAINQHLYESPLSSGYGTFSTIYASQHVLPNFINYATWLVQAQTPFIFLGLAAPVLLHRQGDSGARAITALALGVSAGVFLSYLFYTPFGHWTYLRFLLPALPVMLVLAAAVFVRIAPSAPRWRTLTATALVVGLGVWGVWTGRTAFRVRADEARYLAAARIATALPDNAVIVSNQHSGSLRYYASRITMRFEWLDPDMYLPALQYLEQIGRPVYVVLDDWERDIFRRRYAPVADVSWLDRPPLVLTNEHVYFYALLPARNR